MSRPDKRLHRDHVVGTGKDESVRLYAFANTRPGYQVVFSPETPLIVLKTRKAADKPQQHPCVQWAPLASMLFTQQPNTTHALYVVDTTGLPDGMEREEGVTFTAGPVVKRLANVMAKLNPHNGTMVAAGVSGALAFKCIVMGEKTLGHSDRLVRRLLLVCPPSTQPFQGLLRAMEKRPPECGYARPDVTVLLSDASAEDSWSALLQKMVAVSAIKSWSVTSNIKSALFSAVLREANIATDGTEVSVETRYKSPRLYRIDFVLSSVTKRTEQQVTLSPLSSSGCDDAVVEGSSTEHDDGDYEGDNAGGHEGEGGSSDAESDDGTSCRNARNRIGDSEEVFGLTSLQHCKGSACIVVEGRIMDDEGTMLGTTQGLIRLKGVQGALKRSTGGLLSVQKGAAVRMWSCVHRDERGCTSLKMKSVLPLTKSQERRSMTVCAMNDVPAYNISDVAHAYGALLIRGRKCVLVRSLDESDGGVRLPYLLHTSSEESAMECAERALCEHCDISPDNFYMPSYLPPVSVYEKNASNGLTTSRMIYVALAVTPAAGGAGDSMEDEEDPNEPYDWFSYAKALRMLETDMDKRALEQLQSSIRSAHDAGLYIPLQGLGLFGDAVLDASCTTPTEGCTASALKGALEGLELLVVCAPGDVSGRATRMTREYATKFVVCVRGDTPRSEILQAAQAALGAGESTLALCLRADVDVNTFSEEQLTYWSGKGARPRLVTLLFPGVSEMILQQNDEYLSVTSTFVYSVMLADVLVTVDEDSRNFTVETWGLLRLAHVLNSELVLCAGLVSRNPISVPSIVTTGAGNAHVSCNECSLHEIVFSSSSCPVDPLHLAPLLETSGLDICYKHAIVLWAQGEVWIASTPQSRGFLSLDVCSRCLTLEEGDPCEDVQDGEAEKGTQGRRENMLTLYVWATVIGRDEVEKTVRGIWESVTGRCHPPTTNYLEGCGGTTSVDIEGK